VSPAKPGKNYLPALAAVVAIGALLFGAVFWLRSFLGQKVDPPKQVVQEVRIVRPPPPPETEPPPPPPPQEEVDVPDPQQQPDPVASDEPPPGDQLGVDAQGTGAGDGFGLVGRPGGRDLLATGGSVFAWYGGLVKDEILQRLTNDSKVRSGSYSVAVRIWVKHNGQIERATLVGSSGDRERDRAIERVLTQMTQLPQPPPANMPQPINLKIVSRA
jgi:periplasmic protein TonB